MLAPWKKSYDKSRERIKKQRHYFVDKVCSQSYGFSSSHYGCESWNIKKAECQRIDAFKLWWWRRLLRVPWTVKRSNQSILRKSVLNITGRTVAEAEAPINLPPDAKNWLTEKDPDADKDLRQEEKEMTETEMVEWHHRLNEHEFEQAPGVSDGQGSLAHCSPWDHKESDMTEWLNWTDFSLKILKYHHLKNSSLKEEMWGIGLNQEFGINIHRKLFIK